ncbi:MAG TPA: hypothetical protein VGF79_00910 [Bacteroidia bacterium]
MKLKIETIFHSNSPDIEEMIKEIDEGVKYTVVIYNIDAISPFYLGPDRQYSIVHSGASNFMIDMKVDDLEALIDKHRELEIHLPSRN